MDFVSGARDDSRDIEEETPRGFKQRFKAVRTRSHLSLPDPRLKHLAVGLTASYLSLRPPRRQNLLTHESVHWCPASSCSPRLPLFSHGLETTLGSGARFLTRTSIVQTT